MDPRWLNYSLLSLSHWFRHQQLDGGDAPSALCPQGGALHHHHGDSRSPLFLRGQWRRGCGPRLRRQDSAGVRRRRQWGQVLLRLDDCRRGGTARCYLKRVRGESSLPDWMWSHFNTPTDSLLFIFLFVIVSSLVPALSSLYYDF